MAINSVKLSMPAFKSGESAYSQTMTKTSASNVTEESGVTYEATVSRGWLDSLYFSDKGYWPITVKIDDGGNMKALDDGDPTYGSALRVEAVMSSGPEVAVLNSPLAFKTTMPTFKFAIAHEAFADAADALPNVIDYFRVLFDNEIDTGKAAESVSTIYSASGNGKHVLSVGSENGYDYVFSYKRDGVFPTGHHRLQLLAADKRGNTIASPVYSFVTDTDAPDLINVSWNGKPFTESFDWMYDRAMIGTLTYTVTDDFSANPIRKTYIDGNLVGASSGEVTADYSETVTTDASTNSVNVTAKINFFATGRHDIRIEYSDDAGNNGWQTLTVIVDRTPPLIDFVEKTPGRIYNRENIHIEFNVYDVYADASKASGIDIDSLKVSVNGEIIGSDMYNAGVYTSVDGVKWPYGYYYNVFLTDVSSLIDNQTIFEGENEISVEISDMLGNIAYASNFYVIDIDPPVVTITSPVPDELYTSSPLTVTGYVEDNIDQAITLSIDPGVGRTEEIDVHLGEEFEFSVPFSGEEGVYNFYVYASTESGYNQEEVLYFSYRIDTVGPEILDIVWYVNGVMVEEYPAVVDPGASLTIEVTADDYGGA